MATKHAELSTQEKINYYQKRIKLLEGDRKAYYETAEWTKEQNSKKVEQLRKENKDLRKKLADSLTADEHVINKAFENRPVERNSMKNKTGDSAIEIMDQKVSDAKKRLNSARHAVAQRQKRCEELHTQMAQMKKDAAEQAATTAGKNNAARHLRNLENRLDKAKLKLTEAEHIRRTYFQIRSRLQSEALTFEVDLDEKYKGINGCQDELKELKALHNDAKISKDAAQMELRKHEEVVYSERKKREIELNKMKKEAEERRLQHEKIEKRMQTWIAQGRSDSMRMTQDEDSGQADKLMAVSCEQEQLKISQLEESFRRIKDATGVSDLWEVVGRFEKQGETQARLEEQKAEAEKVIARLREEKQKIQQEFEDMKYSGESKLSSGQQLLENFEKHLQEEETRRDKVNDQLEKSSNILVSSKSGVEHLAQKLQHLKGQKSHAPSAQVSPLSDEYVLELLSQCEEKLLKLYEEVDENDESELKRQMFQEDHRLRERLPGGNVRIALASDAKAFAFQEDEDSGDDEVDLKSSEQVKKEARELAEYKAKGRRTVKKKK